MKLTSGKINNYIQNLPKDLPGILLFGQDQGLLSVLVRNIKKSYLGENHSGNDTREIDSAILKQSPEKLAEEAFNLDLLASNNKIIIIKASSSTITPIIEEYINNHASNTLLIVEAEDLPPNNSLRKLFEGHKTAVAIPCYHDNSSSLENAIKQILSQNNYKIDNDALLWLVNHLGNDRLVTEQELNKLMLYKNLNTYITLEDVILTISDNSELAINKLIFNTFSGKAFASYNIFNQIKEDFADIAIIRGFINHARKLLSVLLTIKQQNISINDAVNQLKPPILFMYVDSFKQQLNLWNITKINRWLYKLNELEFQSKSSPSISGILISNFITETTLELNKK
ncbi:DNA polymerase III subunit delta [Rickettsiales bacterium LUAb2]